MSWFKDLFSSVDKIVDKIPTEQEREQIRGEIAKELTKLEAEFDLKMQTELTERLKADMESSSWLNKHIRAIILLIYTFILIGLPFIPNTPHEVIDLYTTCAMLVYGFYFGGKSFEKSFEIIKTIKKGGK